MSDDFLILAIMDNQLIIICYLNVYSCLRWFVGPPGNPVKITSIGDYIVLPHTVFSQSGIRCKRVHNELEIVKLDQPLFVWYFPGFRMHLGIGCTFKPGVTLALQELYIYENSAPQEVVLGVSDYVLNLPFFM